MGFGAWRLGRPGGRARAADKPLAQGMRLWPDQPDQRDQRDKKRRRSQRTLKLFLLSAIDAFPPGPWRPWTHATTLVTGHHAGWQVANSKSAQGAGKADPSTRRWPFELRCRAALWDPP